MRTSNLYPHNLILILCLAIIAIVISCGSGGDSGVIKTELMKLADDINPEYVSVSDDFRHYAMFWTENEKEAIIIDGQTQQIYDEVGGFSFSPDGLRHAYWGRIGDQFYPVIDGQQGEPYTELGNMIFSPDSKRLAFFADGTKVVLDGQAGKTYEGVGRYGPVFSPDSRHLAYEVIQGWQMMVVVDSSEGKPYTVTLAESLTFDPTSRHIAYLAKTDSRYFLVLDSLEGKPYGEKMFREVIFSPDGNRVAYTADLGVGYMVIVDSVESELYDGIQWQGPKFSPDSKSVVFGATRGNKRFCVLNGEKLKEFDAVGGMAFNPVSGKLAYFANQEESACIVCDGVESDQFPCLGLSPLLFSPDGQHLAYGRFNADSTYSIVLDGRDVGTYDYIYTEPMPSFTDSGTLVFAMVENSKLIRIEVMPR